MDVEYNKIVKQYSVSYMNNAKWRKIFTAWAKSGIEIAQAEWEFIGTDHKEFHPLPRENELMERRFADGQFQPFEYKWILAIRIPQKYKPISNVGFERKQDVNSLVDIAKNLGYFPVFETENGVEIIGYER